MHRISICRFESIRRFVGLSTTVLLVFALFIPLSVAAAGDPQTDPTCWPSAACQQVNGHFERDSACVASGWGRCYAQRPIDIQVHIPGLEGKQVRDLAQYIQVVYAWGVRVAAIAAVIAIMVGGLLWLTSGGAERLGKAKELIGNAVIGLLLALFSFVILKTVNPDLVRLSLPRTMMIRTVAMGAQFCSGVPADVPIRDGGAEGAIVADTARGSLRCGLIYHTPTASTKTCIGEVCDPGSLCLPTTADRFGCEPALIGGQISADGDAYPGDTNMALHAVCRDPDGDFERPKIAEGRVWAILEDRQYGFGFPKMTYEAVRQKVLNACGGDLVSVDVVLRGFYIDTEVHDTVLDDHFALGSRTCGSTRPISYTMTDMSGGNERTTTAPGDIPWSGVSAGDLLNKDQILSAALSGTAMTCNMTWSRSNFTSR